MIAKTTYDCVVIGAGPAGCAAAALIAQVGFDTLLVERAKFPRNHVGESLMPETFWTLERLGVLDRLRDEGFVRKVGVQFVDATGRNSQPFFFQQHDPRECSKTFHVERQEFDQLLFENAAEKGAECQDQTRVTSVDVRTTPNFLRLKTSDGNEHDITARVVVDASGQQSLLANQLKLKIDNPDLHKASIWGYYQGAKRVGNDAEELTTILHGDKKKSWFWHIPLTHDIVSIGLIADNEYLFKANDPITIFEDEVSRCPGVMERLDGARRVGDLEIAREFSYSTSQHAGDGWVLVGDAYGFIDPVYSTGVFLALRSGELAADAIASGLAVDDVSAGQLGSWTEEFDAGVRRFRALVSAFYTKQFSFAAFLKQHPEHLSNLTDLLIGRAFTDAAARLCDDLVQAMERASTGDSSDTVSMP